MNKDIVTIVVPVYNTEKYVGECLDSLLCQTYENIRIVCVDDGSKDNSFEVVHNYELKDERVSYYRKENGGAASARNFGIEIFLKDDGSEYITFVDSDDTVENDFVETLYTALKEYDADVATCNLYRYKGGRGSKEKHLYSKNEAINGYFRDQIFYESPCCKMFRKDIVRKVRFDEGKYFEDTFICYKWLNEIDKVAFVDYASYNVRVRSGSTTNSGYSNNNYDKIEAGKEIYENYKGTEFEQRAYNKYLGIIFYFLLKTNRKKDTISKNRQAINDIKEIIKKNGFSNAYLKFYPFIIATKLNFIDKVFI